MGPVDSPETPVTTYQPTSRNNPEGRFPFLFSGSSVRSLVELNFFSSPELPDCLWHQPAFPSFGKGKAVPLQAWSGPEGSGKLMFPDFMTTAQDGGKVVSLTHRPHLPPGNSRGTHFC